MMHIFFSSHAVTTPLDVQLLIMLEWQMFDTEKTFVIASKIISCQIIYSRFY